ncbi:MAG: hypothetical protein HY423_11595 [Candidatus Lambdaproteobacteria bacterium]|nr:hypothetical protein [Candidatus Lambdaproteobacteria bacterium]
MPGRRSKRRPLPDPARVSLALLALGTLACVLVATALPSPAAAKSLRRSAPFIRALLMSDAYTAVADEASAVQYNPAGIAGLADGSLEAFVPAFYFDDKIKTAILEPEKLQARYQNLTDADFEKLLGEHIFAQINIRMPVVTLAGPHLAIGLIADAFSFVEILQNPVLPGLHIEFYADEVLFFAKAWNLTESLAFGITPKVINRIGLDKTFTFAELFASGGTLDLESQPAFQQLLAGTSYQAGALDVGFLYRFPFLEGWQPRMGIALLNIGGYSAKDGLRGMKFGKRPSGFEPPIAGEIPQINTVGFAVSPAWAGVRVTLALDVVDVTRSATPGSDWIKRTRLGLAAEVFPHEDGTALFSLLAGLAGTRPSYGVMSRVFVFEIGFGLYDVELGNADGDRVDHRTAFTFGFRF